VRRYKGIGYKAAIGAEVEVEVKKTFAST